MLATGLVNLQDLPYSKLSPQRRSSFTVPPKKSSDHKSSRRVPVRAPRRKAPPQEAAARKSIPAKQRPDARVRRANVGALFEALVALQAQLRAPGGCPWDREQTHDSLRTYLVEETYEVLDALDTGDPRKLAGELGDVLLQVVFHAELGAEAGRFDIADVIEHVHSKMVRRHPHVFADAKARSSAQVVKNWEQIKAEERRAEQKGNANGSKDPAEPEEASLLDGVSRSQPAVLEAQQLTRRAARVGFDWPNIEGLFDKLAEESIELRQALDVKDPAAREEEVGDLLFVGVNLARFLGLDAEIALKKANRKFATRFREMEQLAAGRGQKLPDLSPSQLELLWGEVKAASAPATEAV